MDSDMILKIIIGVLIFMGIAIAVLMILDTIKNKDKIKNEGNPIIAGIISLITNFFDALGIGSFAPTTALFKFTNYIKNDTLIPGTLNVAFTIPVIAEAILFMSKVEVEAITLVSMVIAAMVGSWIGAGIISKLPERIIQLIMGIALILTALLMLSGKLGLIAELGKDNTAIGLTGIMLIIGIIGNFILGALMTAGIGLYAPCMAMVYMLGLNPSVAFPIMMTSCAALMPVAGAKFIKEGKYLRLGSIVMSITGVIGVFIAVKFVTGLSIDKLMWLVIIVIILTGLMMLKKGLNNKYTN